MHAEIPGLHFITVVSRCLQICRYRYTNSVTLSNCYKTISQFPFSLAKSSYSLITGRQVLQVAFSRARPTWRLGAGEDEGDASKLTSFRIN